MCKKLLKIVYFYPLNLRNEYCLSLQTWSINSFLSSFSSFSLLQAWRSLLAIEQQQLHSCLTPPQPHEQTTLTHLVCGSIYRWHSSHSMYILYTIVWTTHSVTTSILLIFFFDFSLIIYKIFFKKKYKRF